MKQNPYIKLSVWVFFKLNIQAMRSFKLYKSITVLALLWCIIACGKTSEVIEEITPEPEPEKEYVLVWSDEFNSSSANNKLWPLPSDQWWFEIGGTGWGNNEEQYYVNREFQGDTVAIIKDGKLQLTAHKLEVPYKDRKYISARMNTKQSWKYGYIEVRAKLPKGVGAWPAFWLLPEIDDPQLVNGEIDIMEFVGYEPDKVHFSVHTAAFNHQIGTGKTTFKTMKNASDEFHLYGVEWTEKGVFGYIDQELYFSFLNESKGDYNKWPFDYPFYLKLNMAIGGAWGGYEGVDDTAFPITMEIDHVRVYQKQNR